MAVVATSFAFKLLARAMRFGQFSFSKLTIGLSALANVLCHD
jgi:hypothetical protein